MVGCNNINVMQVAQEIQQYLYEHPYAADTVEGITRCWLFNHDIGVTQSLAQQALDILVSASILDVKNNRGGNAIYSSAKSKPESP